MMLHIKEEDVLFLDITPNTDEDGQAMKDGVHVSFAVLRTSKEEADAAVVVLRSLTGEKNQAGVPNARLLNYLKAAVAAVAAIGRRGAVGNRGARVGRRGGVRG